MKKLIVVLVVIVLIFVSIYFINQSPVNKTYQIDTTQDQDITTDTTKRTGEQPVAVTKEPEPDNGGQLVIGKSVEGRDITAYTYGRGGTELLFIGGIHGGYEWNTVIIAYQLMDYLQANSKVIPDKMKVTVIPVLNPDGLNKTISTTSRFTAADVPTSQDKQVAGRFNANNVDLNRNFDCDWQAEGKWQNKTVSGGSQAFSEPESLAIKNYVETNKPVAIVVWYSSAGGVFASNCHNGVLPETVEITNAYAKASGYSAHESFDFYEITGDMVNWLAQNKIPAISVLLSSHDSIEWDKNQKGVDALLKYYSK